MSSSVIAHGTLLKMGDGATPEQFTTVAEVRTLGGPSETVDSIEVTNMDSTSFRKEFIPGMIDSGQIQATVNWLPQHATHDRTTGYRKKLSARTVANWKLVVPCSPTLTLEFAGFVTNSSPDFQSSQQLQNSITIKITGDITDS